MDAFWKILTKNWIDVRLRVVMNLRARFLSSKPAPTEERKLTQRSEKDFCPFLIWEWVWELWRPQTDSLSEVAHSVYYLEYCWSFVLSQIHKYDTNFRVHFSWMHKLATLFRIDSVRRKVKQTKRRYYVLKWSIQLYLCTEKNTIHSSIRRLVINKLLQPKHEDTIDHHWQLLTA